MEEEVKTEKLEEQGNINGVKKVIDHWNCHHKCEQRISNQQRKNLLDNFRSLKRHAQKEFLAKYCKRRDNKNRLGGQGKHFRTPNIDYHLPTENGDIAQVCATFFNTTIGHKLRSRQVKIS